MSLDDIKTRLSRILEEVQGIQAELERPGSAPSPWRTVAEYAKQANTSAETVRRWIKAGMPATDVKRDANGKVDGVRRTTRINVDEADAWRRTR